MISYFISITEITPRIMPIICINVNLSLKIILDKVQFKQIEQTVVTGKRTVASMCAER